MFANGAKIFLRVWRKQSFSHQKAIFLLPATLRLMRKCPKTTYKIIVVNGFGTQLLATVAPSCLLG